MKELFSKRIARLGLIYLIYATISIMLYFVSNIFIYRWLAVNLFFACLPLMFSTLARAAKQRKNKFMYIVAVLLWLMFFPNAPYMITDLIHIPYLGFNSDFVVKYIAAWFGLAYMTVGVIFGILAGLFSLDAIIQLVFKTKGRGMTVIAVAAVSILSGYAIYIGRFLRFNSWDMFYPVSLIKTLIQDFSLFTVSFSLLFAAYIAFSYLVFCILKKK